MEEKVLDMLESICEDAIVRENPDIDLFENELLDSLTFTELLVEIENQFGLIISPSEVSRDDFGSPNKIIALIRARS